MKKEVVRMEETIEKKLSFFERLHVSKKKQVIFFGISMVVMLCVYSYISYYAQFKNNRRVKLVKDDFSWMFQIDSCEEKEDNLVLTGWAFALGKDAKEGNFEIILSDISEEKNYYPKMEYLVREDVNKYFLCEYEYLESGFLAYIPKKVLDLESKIYRIAFRPSDERKAYESNMYYVNGKIMHVNPEEYTPLDVQGTDIEHIVETGVLRVYRSDVGMYVYQYENELYWIAENWYEFEKGNSMIEFQMNTTQLEKLPQNRIEKGWFWDNLSFSFISNELIDCDTGKYRVSKCALPSEYSLTRVWTGNYISEWTWIEYFRPWYEFN